MVDLNRPYWACDATDYPFPDHHFNREILEPGVNKAFPNGAVGIRVDDDFWSVAALPLGQFRGIPIEQIVALLWPDLTNPTFGPDSTIGKE